MSAAGGAAIGVVMRMSSLIKGVCLFSLGAIYLLAPAASASTVSIAAEPLEMAQNSSALLPLRACEHGEDAAAALGEFTAQIKSIPALPLRNNSGVRFLTPLPAQPVFVRNPFLPATP